CLSTFFLHDTAPPHLSTLSLHDALPISTCSTDFGVRALANSRGFGGAYRFSSAALQVEVMADDEEGKKRNDYWYTVERSFDRLRSEEHTSELQSRFDLVCRLLLEKKNEE